MEPEQARPVDIECQRSGALEMSLRLRRLTACAALGAALLLALPAEAAPALTDARFTEFTSSKPNTLAAFHG
jgi:hypothetical protein